MDRDEVMCLYVICDWTRAQALTEIAVFFAEGLVCCYREFVIIKGITRLFHKHIKVPRGHLKYDF